MMKITNSASGSTIISVFWERIWFSLCESGFRFACGDLADKQLLCVQQMQALTTLSHVSVLASRMIGLLRRMGNRGAPFYALPIALLSTGPLAAVDPPPGNNGLLDRSHEILKLPFRLVQCLPQCDDLWGECVAINISGQRNVELLEAALVEG